MEYDVIIVGAGIAGLTAACELIDAKKRVLLVDQENENAIGGQAFWSFGGLFLVDSPEQRRLGVKDSFELAWQDWQGTAGFDRLEDEDYWGYEWAKAYVEFAAYEKYSWLKSKGIKFFPVVGWAERGGSLAGGHGNSVPRFHIVWGTGPGIVEPFAKKVLQAVKEGQLDYQTRHQVTELVVENGTVVGVRGNKLAPSDVERGVESSREIAGEFEYFADAVVVSSGGIGANFELVKENWPSPFVDRYQRFSKEWNQVVRIRSVKAKTFKEAAEVLGTSPTTVMRRFKELVKTLFTGRWKKRRIQHF